MEIRTGSQLEHAVADLGRAMGLEVRTQVRIGRRSVGAAATH